MVWVQRLRSHHRLHPDGLNDHYESHSLAQSPGPPVFEGDPLPPAGAPRRRWFAARDMRRRLLHLQHQYRAYGPFPATYFASYGRCTLHRLYAYLTYHPPAALGTDPDFHEWLLTPVADAILAAEQGVGRPSFNHRLWLPPGLRQLISMPDLHRILDSIPLPAGCPRPPIHWSPDEPLHKLFCTYDEFARRLTAAQYAHLVDPATPCACAQSPGLCPPGIPHVMSTSPYTALPDGIHAFWNYGGRYRPHRPVDDVPAVLAAVRSSALRFTRQLAQQQGAAAAQTSRWAHELVDALAAHIADAEPHQFFWPVLSHSDLADLHTRCDDFIITVTDKSSSTFQLVCKKFYAEQCMRDLGCHNALIAPPGAPAPPPAPPPAAAAAAPAGPAPPDAPYLPSILIPPLARRTRAQAPAHDAVTAAELAALTNATTTFTSRDTAAASDAAAFAAYAPEFIPPAPPAVPAYYEPGTAAARDSFYAAQNTRLAPWRLQLQTTLPPAYYAGTLKMHKQPPSMRYLACSQRCPVTELSDLATAVLRAAAVEFNAMWHAALPGSDPWLCLSSNAVMALVRQHNAAQFPPDRAFPHAARDFSRLYTNLPHADLRNTLSRLLHRSLATCPIIHVLSYPPDPAKPGSKPDHVVTFKAGGSAPTRYHAGAESVTPEFTVTDFCNIFLDVLLSSTFIRFGPALVRQICGIPMGISAAPFIANLFLGWYEFEFLCQSRIGTLNPTQRAILRRFRLSRRFPDDLLCLNNPWLKHLLYTSQSYEGLRGLYPPALAVPEQSHPHLPPSCVPFLDVLLCSTVHLGRCWIVTQLYDKREQPAFGGVRLSRFVARHSSVNEQCKRNIFVSQFHRLARVITCVENFAYEAAQLVAALSAQGYSRPCMFRQFTTLLWRNPHLFYFVRRGHPEPPAPPTQPHQPLDLLARLHVYLRGAPPPAPPPAAGLP
ncbi:hypothetical protein CHLRE_04g218550v5 [Chlamydomonas reinhardtii]|uniref:Reverse transcriptase domain-containing protein n=1 Tax=Chlamydomonas reinhardtii TaxID=3055 RepID=A0A2K3DU24_CHLRE|nr:uncharacterized protein CHLRE_04g218550v5 [Chlamydomonas reinhardtii]PNW84036.1 hypothetical protein CHLRE_04g218550v5 [Chlamydomonas reinhardtii]